MYLLLSAELTAYIISNFKFLNDCALIIVTFNCNEEVPVKLSILSAKKSPNKNLKENSIRIFLNTARKETIQQPQMYCSLCRRCTKQLNQIYFQYRTLVSSCILDQDVPYALLLVESAVRPS